MGAVGWALGSVGGLFSGESGGGFEVRYRGRREDVNGDLGAWRRSGHCQVIRGDAVVGDLGFAIQNYGILGPVRCGVGGNNGDDLT